MSEPEGGDFEPVRAWLAAQAEEAVETSCAWVFLAGDAALKLKKRVDYGFLDFTTLEKRRWALERELSFNRRFAPDIYRRLRRITREGDGYAFDGDGETVDLVLEMRRFDRRKVLSETPGALTVEIAEALGRRIARDHIAAPVTPDGGGVKALGYTIRTNAEHLRLLKGPLDADAVERVVAGTDAAFAAMSPLLEARRKAGFARHCHGDLHLGNILLEDGEPKPFDCIEFNDLLSEIDTLYDIAFTLMDLCFRGRQDAANRALNAYLDEAQRGLPPGVLEGLAALPLMLSARATVRAHVSWHSGAPEQSAPYLAAAEAHLNPPPPRLLAIGGVSGTGKSTIARLVAPRLGAAPGAVILRSDEVRKRLLGQAPTDRAGAAAYARDAVQKVYARMMEDARIALAAGCTVILDATFLDVANRDEAAALARSAGVPFHGVWLTAPAQVLEARVGARHGDASDATVATLRQQLARDRGRLDWTVTDAVDAEAAAGAIAAAAGARP
ncbi:MAG TPA: AAA family ATPase [Caulobacteraceae bacterium]|nr:AAA family ATPase [Caulobacteraceae bacterium]